MTAARLEELAVWAEAEAMECQYEGSMLRSAKFADLARCARGWAKVETSPNPSIDRWEWPQGNKWYYRTSSRNTGTADTALEAVEAAEVTDANKG